MKKKTPNVPLTTEPHPDDYTGYPFITLVRYNDENSLNIIDNVRGKQIIGYVLDLCAPSGIDEIQVITLVEEWFYSGRHEKIPISVEFSRMGVAAEMSTILRCYPSEYVTRVIGPLFEYPMSGVIKSKRRKKKSIPTDLGLENPRD